MRFSSIHQILSVLYVRLRFVLILLVIFVVVGKWEMLRAYWDAMVRLGKADQRSQPVSFDSEYFCPMCPGVLSEWPAKCPVCNMGLVRRKKGDAVPLPDGVVARMQLSPYRLQLAGVRTSAVGYEPLAYELTTGGFVQSAKESRQVLVQAPVYEHDVPFLEPGQTAEIVCDALPGRPSFVGRVH
jgi:Cu(I)/Ag(I) efflux system membrane fusion protein